MIALDTSALVAIALLEPEAEAFDRLVSSRATLIGAPTLVEAHLVLSSKGGTVDIVSVFSRRDTVRIVAFDEQLYRIASQAFDLFGRGRHAAKLNYGDCLSYAVAKHHGIPLLFKGDDFIHTDVEPAIDPS